MRSKNTTLPYWLDYCTRIFGTPMKPKTESWNMRYGGKNPVVTKVIFTNGEEDPWKWASILETKNPDIMPIEIKCDDCAHCIDLHADLETDPPQVTDARNLIITTITQWV